MREMIFPRALVLAAREFAAKPAVVGEVLVALCATEVRSKKEEGRSVEKKMSEVQRYILAACREEMAARSAKREAERERKKRERNRRIVE